MDHSKTAEGVLRGVGGESNVQSLVHCMTRLRFVVRDRDQVDTDAVRATPGVITTAEAGGQYQVVIGNEVPEVFAEIRRTTGIGGDDASTAAEQPKGNLFNRFIGMIAALFTPLLWALAGTGLLKAFLAAATTFGWIDPTTSTYTILNALSDSFIFFLPIALAFTAAKYFDAQQFTSVAIAGALVYPSIVTANGAPDFTFFGIPVTMVSYVSSVIPIIVVVWLQSYAERFLYKVFPAAVRRFLVPMLLVLVLVPLVFIVIGPLSNLLSSGLAAGISWVFSVAPWLGGAIMGGLWQVFVIFGLHWGFIPIVTLEFQTNASSFLSAPLYAAVLAQAAAVAGVLIRSKSATRRAVAAPATLSGFLAGITEPAIYGVNLPLKRPFAFGIVGGVLGGAIIAAGGVASSSFAVPSLLALPALFSIGSTVALIIGLVVAIAVPFLLTVVVGFKEPEAEAAATPETDVVVTSPVDGTVVPLSEVADAAFAGGDLGKGVAIRPRAGAVYAPFDGMVVAAFPTGHAIGLRSTAGAELLIHIGLDTVRLGGEHFTVHVADGDTVTQGQLLIEVDVAAVEAAGYDTTTPIVVTNGAEFGSIGGVASGPVAHGDALFVAVAEPQRQTA